MIKKINIKTQLDEAISKKFNIKKEDMMLKPPLYWYSTGNYSLNKCISGDFNKGIAQGRLTGLTGPSGAGKSFLMCNILREAQKDGAMIYIIDTEHAFDPNFFTSIGVDIENNFTYAECGTTSDLRKHVKILHDFYTDNYAELPIEEQPKLLFAVDSLTMLETDVDTKHFKTGEIKSDMGRKNKELKVILRDCVNLLKVFNISMIVTSGVYKNQDHMSAEGTWVIPDGIKYALSQNILITRTKLRGSPSEVDGIKMRCNVDKTRFTKPYQTVVIEVPYDIGMDPYSGLLETAVSLNVVDKGGSWYTLNKGTDNEIKFQSKKIAEHADEIIKQTNDLGKIKINIEN